MLTHTDLKKGAKIILDGQPYEVLESSPMKKAQRRVVIQTRIKNLITGNVLERNFHQGDVFEEAEIEKFEAKFLYSYKNRYFFCEKDNPAKRFDLEQELLGEAVRFLKPNQIVEGIQLSSASEDGDEMKFHRLQGKVINVSLPIKIQLKVIEAPPGIKGDRAQGGTKIVTLETGAKINVPLFIEERNIIEVNTETGEYVKRIE